MYERFTAAFVSENAGIEVSVTPNAKIVGKSRVGRQIDVLVDARWGDKRSRRVIVDAKMYGRKLDIKDVEAFEGMMRDCRADRGILFCPSGWTGGAKRRAQDAITIQMMSLEELEATTS